MSTLSARDVAIAACSTSAFVHAWLVTAHRDESLLAASFGCAAVALAVVGFALTQPSRVSAPPAATGLFAGLLVAYPIVVLAGGDGFDALGLATKAVEAVGLAALVAGRRTGSFGSADALVGAVLGTLLVSVLGHGH